MAVSVGFESIVACHDRFIAKLISLLFLRNTLVTSPLVKVIEAARSFSSLVTHRRGEKTGLAEAMTKFEKHLRLFIDELKECQERFSYVHIADFLAALNFNGFYD
jgi:hypothetical protein